MFGDDVCDQGPDVIRLCHIANLLRHPGLRCGIEALVDGEDVGTAFRERIGDTPADAATCACHKYAHVSKLVRRCDHVFTSFVGCPGTSTSMAKTPPDKGASSKAAAGSRIEALVMNRVFKSAPPRQTDVGRGTGISTTREQLA